jgi:enoyl-CoA hydratase/carnithine racemase
LTTAIEVAWKLAAKPSGALRASKRLMKSAFVDQIKAAMALENKEYSVLTRSKDAKEAFAAFLEKRAPDFNKTRKSTPAA